MPVTVWPVEPEYLYRDNNLGVGADILESQRAHSICNIMRQLISISNNIESIFFELNEDITSLATRRTSITNRLTAISKAISKESISEQNIDASSFSDVKEWQLNITIGAPTVDRKTIPKPIAALYNECVPNPDVSIFDQFRNDGLKSMSLYSDPSFFFNYWISSFQKSMEKKQGKKQQRKAKKIDETAVSTITAQPLEKSRLSGVKTEKSTVASVSTKQVDKKPSKKPSVRSKVKQSREDTFDDLYTFSDENKEQLESSKKPDKTISPSISKKPEVKRPSTTAPPPPTIPKTSSISVAATSVPKAPISTSSAVEKTEKVVKPKPNKATKPTSSSTSIPNSAEVFSSITESPKLEKVSKPSLNSINAAKREKSAFKNSPKMNLLHRPTNKTTLSDVESPMLAVTPPRFSSEEDIDDLDLSPAPAVTPKVLQPKSVPAPLAPPPAPPVAKPASLPPSTAAATPPPPPPQFEILEVKSNDPSTQLADTPQKKAPIAVSSGATDLLSAIKLGKQLKKVDNVEKKVVDEFAGNDVASILARRIQLVGDSDSEDDEEIDGDDWD